MKSKYIPLILIIIFLITFVIFFKGLKNSNIYTPDTNLKKEVPSFKLKSFEDNSVVISEEIFKDKFYMTIFLVISFLLSALIIKQFDINFLINTILVTSAFFLFFSTSREFFVKRFRNLSQNIAHFGFSLLILSILFNNIFSNEVITNLKIGETFETEKFSINFENVKQKDGKNFRAIIGKFNVQNLDGSSDILNP